MKLRYRNVREEKGDEGIDLTDIFQATKHHLQFTTPRAAKIHSYNQHKSTLNETQEHTASKFRNCAELYFVDWNVVIFL